MRGLLSLGIAVTLVTFAGPAAHAGDVFGPPDYVHALWFRVGFATDGHFSYGVSAEAQPYAVGVEISPRSPAGLVRPFLGLKASGLWPESSCAAFVGVGAFFVFALGPGTAPQFGLRLDARLRHMAMRNDGPPANTGDPPPPIKTKRGEGISYNFSWLSRTGTLSDFGLELGAFRAPGSYCAGD